MQLDPATLKQARAEFFHSGRSIAAWARENEFRQELVYAVLNGRCKATRGESHRIAVQLGLKAGRPRNPSPDVKEIM